MRSYRHMGIIAAAGLAGMTMAIAKPNHEPEQSDEPKSKSDAEPEPIPMSRQRRRWLQRRGLA